MKENLMDLLHSEGQLNAGMQVRTNVLKDMEIYGFIPMTFVGDYLGISYKTQTVDMMMKNTIIVSDRLSVIFEKLEPRNGGSFMSKAEKNEVHPIMRCVHLQENNKKLRLPLFGLYVPQFRYEKYYLDFRKNVVPVVGRAGSLPGVVVVEEEDRSKPIDPQHPEETTTVQVCYYELNENELLFGHNTHSQVRAVGEEFVVICRRLNPVTGNSVLEIFNPEELYPVHIEERN